MSNLAFGFVSPCFILVQGRNDPTDAEWDRYLEFLQDKLQSRRIAPRTVVYSQGGGLTPKQRKRLNEISAPYAADLKVAVVTKSAMTRSIVTALSWFVKGYRAFSPDDLDAALSFLDLGEATAVEVRKQISKLKLQLLEA
jgi:hypothetical protein